MYFNSSALFGLLLALFVNAWSVSALPTREHTFNSTCTTNSDCLKRGLPLLPPSRSRSRRAIVPQPSEMVDTYQYIFRLGFSSTPTGPILYYLKDQNNGGNVNYVVDYNDASEAMVLKTNVAPLDPAATQLNFRISNPTAAGFDWLGFWYRYASTNGNIPPSGDILNEYGYPAAGSRITTKGSTPEAVAVYSGSGSTTATYYESAIFNLDTPTGAVTATWINADPAVYGPSTPLYFMVISGSYLFITSDPTGWHNANSNYVQYYAHLERLF